MLTNLLSNPDSLKRLLAKLFGLGVILMSPTLLSKLGIVITDVQVEMAAGVVAAYLVQSGFVAAAKAQAAGKVAADKVVTVADAAKILAPVPDSKPTPPMAGK